MIRHLLATDVRRFRWTLAVWVGLLVVYASLLWIMPGTVDDKARFDTLSTALLLLFFVVHFAPIVIVPMIVQADAAVGSDVFWATRPIPPRALLAAKAILVALMIVILPASLELAAMLAAHVPGSEIVRIAASTLLASAVWLALLLAASAVTPNYPKFALLGVCVVVGLAACLIIWQTIISIGARNTSVMVLVGVNVVPETPDFTGFVLFMAGLIVACCAVLVLQYERRQRIVSVPAGAGTVVVAFLAATWWPWPLIHRPVAPPDWAAGVHVKAVSAVTTFDPAASWLRPDMPRTGRLPLRVDGIPPEWFASIRLDDGRYTLPGGGVVRTQYHGMTDVLPFEGTDEPPMRVTVRRLLGVNRLADRQSQSVGGAVAIVASASDIKPLEGTTAAYHGTFTIAFTHAEIAGVIPLRSGASFDGGVYQLTLRDLIGAAAHNVTLNGIETRATSMFDNPGGETYTLYAVNRERSEAIEGSSGARTQLNDFAGFGVHVSLGTGSGFSRHAVAVAFWTSGVPDAITVNEDWLRHADLAIVRTTPISHVVRNVDIVGTQVFEEPPKMK